MTGKIHYLSPDEQVLIFNDIVLEDVITLADYRVKKDSTLRLMRKSSGLVPTIINCPTGKTSFSMNVKLSDTVRDLKAKIPYIKYPHEYKDSTIVFKDIVLDDCCILADFHITVNSVLTLMLKSTSKMMESKMLEIFVKTLAGKTISLDVIATTTIGQVKTDIWYQEHVPEDEQVLIFNEMVLDASLQTISYLKNK
ncbi:polyubiqutin 2 [Tanacetum coccineum]